MADTPSKGGFALYAERLIDNGYEVVPIKRGSKAPVGDDWQKMRLTAADARKMSEGEHSRSGVGILCRSTIGVDLDLLDEKMALGMQQWVEEHFGYTPVRFGMAPKRLLIYQTKAPFPKVNSRTFIDEWGDPNLTHTGSGKPNGDWRKVEVLGDGNQFVAYAIHPDTKRPYEWANRLYSPLNVRRDKLDVLTHDDALAIVTEFERRAEESGYKVKQNDATVTRLPATVGTAAGRVDRNDVFAEDKAKTDIADDELRRKLLLVPGSSDYEMWTHVGMALYHQYDGSDDGLNLWDEWSQTADNYDAEAVTQHWTSFDAAGKGREPITARFIIKKSDENARQIAVETYNEIKDDLAIAVTMEAIKDVCSRIKHIEFEVMQRSALVGLVQKQFRKVTGTAMSLTSARSLTAYENPARKERPRWLAGWVYVSRDKGFYNFTKRYFITTEAFNAQYGRYMLTPKDILEGKSIPEASASAFALNNQQIETVHRSMYLPGEDDLFTLNGKSYVNSYDSTNVPPLPDKLTDADRTAIATAAHHFVHLFPNAAERGHLFDALAYLVQNPNKRLKFAILMQGVEEDGKSWFAHLLAACIGAENLKTITAETLEEKFNSWAEGAQVVFIEELKLQGHNRFDVLNKVKPLLTNAMISVRRMQTDVYNAINTATYIATTNFRDALPLDESDSRYLVLFTRFQTRAELLAFKASDPTYYQRLYQCVEDHAPALRKWLMDYKISPRFDPNERAPMTFSKREMIELAKAEDSSAFDDVVLNERAGLDEYVLSTKMLAEAMADLGVEVPYGQAMNRLLAKKGYTAIGRLRVGDDFTRIWSRHPVRFRIQIGDFDVRMNVDKVKAWLASDL